MRLLAGLLLVLSVGCAATPRSRCLKAILPGDACVQPLEQDADGELRREMLAGYADLCPGKALACLNAALLELGLLPIRGRDSPFTSASGQDPAYGDPGFPPASQEAWNRALPYLQQVCTGDTSWSGLGCSLLDTAVRLEIFPKAMQPPRGSSDHALNASFPDSWLKHYDPLLRPGADDAMVEKLKAELRDVGPAPQGRLIWCPILAGIKAERPTLAERLDREMGPQVVTLFTETLASLVKIPEAPHVLMHFRHHMVECGTGYPIVRAPWDTAVKQVSENLQRQREAVEKLHLPAMAWFFKQLEAGVVAGYHQNVNDMLPETSSQLTVRSACFKPEVSAPRIVGGAETQVLVDVAACDAAQTDGTVSETVERQERVQTAEGEGEAEETYEECSAAVVARTCTGPTCYNAREYGKNCVTKTRKVKRSYGGPAGWKKVTEVKERPVRNTSIVLKGTVTFKWGAQTYVTPFAFAESIQTARGGSKEEQLENLYSAAARKLDKKIDEETVFARMAQQKAEAELQLALASADGPVAGEHFLLHLAHGGSSQRASDWFVAAYAVDPNTWRPAKK